MTCTAQLRMLAGALAAGFALAAGAWASPMPKKIIQFGWGVPDTAYLREHLREMEKLPFDGVVLELFGMRDGEKVDGYTVFRQEAWRRDWFTQCVLDLRATPFSRFTDNFLLAWVTPAAFDWFSDEHWRAITNNISILAWVAEQGGLTGICFDPEPYGDHNPWAYPEQAHADQYDFQQYGEQVRKRGAEFMRAITREDPDTTLFMLFGASAVAESLLSPDLFDPIQTRGYGLLPFFVDGMLDALPAGACIIDGYEGGYYIEERAGFLEAYHVMKHNALAVISPRNRDKYRAQVLAGFGLYPDRNWSNPEWGWHVDDPSKNYYTPAEFQDNLANAVDVSDRYVWVYTEAMLWWKNEKVPPGYEDAVWQVRQAPRLGELAYLVRKRSVPADELAAYLPLEWRFRKDDQGLGVREGWYQPDYDDSAWAAVRTDSQWMQQEPYLDMTGSGWGRAYFDVPASAAGKRLYLLIGALDERGDIYVNGRLVEQRRPTVSGGWRMPFVVDATDVIRPGQRNLVAVYAMADTTLGGVWRPSALLADIYARPGL